MSKFWFFDRKGRPTSNEKRICDTFNSFIDGGSVTKNQVEEYFTKLWDEPLKGKRWKGYRIRNMKDDKNDLDNGNIVLLDETDLVDYSNNDNLPPSMM